MQPIEEFMREYFAARIENQRREMELRAPFRQRFYASDCVFDSREGAVESLESEKIVSVADFGNRAEVITLPDRGYPQRLRFHLQPAEGRWIIHHVDLGCPSCQGEAGRNCEGCKGTGWLLDFLRKRTKAQPSSPRHDRPFGEGEGPSRVRF